MYGKDCYKEILFTDENIFTAEETFSKQNKRVYARSSKEAHKLVSGMEQSHYPFWRVVSYEGATSCIFEKMALKQQ